LFHASRLIQWLAEGQKEEGKLVLLFFFTPRGRYRKKEKQSLRFLSSHRFDLHVGIETYAKDEVLVINRSNG
jgi:hypothetical protein